MPGPLDGVRVLDLSRLLPGGFCTLLLADLGADVVKVEEPRGGDPLRAIPPLRDGVSVYFRALNRNKRSVTLDLRADGAAAVLDRLIAASDVVVESFRPRAARRLGVSGADLLKRHPRLVHCSLTGFGQDGPYSERAAHDLNFVALSGLFELEQGSASRPRSDGARRVPRLLVADVGGAWAAACGIAAALFRRDRKGNGSVVDISIHDVALSWLTFPAAAQLAGESEGSEFPITDGQACYNVYTTSDGREVALAAVEQKFWQMFSERVGRPDFVPLQFVPGVQDELRRQVAGVIASRTLDEWVQAFADVDVCLTPVNSVAAAIADPHARARGSVVDLTPARYVRAPIVIGSGAPGGDSRPAIRPSPSLGADTDGALQAAGIGADQRAALRARRVI